jgi:orotidine-5'-phosphate decarboxylase
VIHIIRDLSNAEIFLDLKLHDIPATVCRAMQGISELGVKFATVHCGENPEMLKAAISGSQGNVGVLGVTVLTSVSADHVREAGFIEEFYSDMQALVMKRAKLAKDTGCAGIVCSGLEVAHIKKIFGKEFVAITPGIRPTWDLSGKDDQQRITTPAQAVQNGADYIVIGRPIRDARDPKAAARRIAEEIGTIL